MGLIDYSIYSIHLGISFICYLNIVELNFCYFILKDLILLKILYFIISKYIYRYPLFIYLY